MKRLELIYRLYEESVLDPQVIVNHINDIYRKIKGKALKPRLLREDFCGTFLVGMTWVKAHRQNYSSGIDLSHEATRMGLKMHGPQLNADELSRCKILHQDVRKTSVKKYDVVFANNFSYFIFRTRDDLKKYFIGVRKSLGKNGVFLMDHFGGPANEFSPQKDRRRHYLKIIKKRFTYYWAETHWWPVKNEAKFAIHFEVDGGPKIKNAFTYHWRMWTLKELQEILLEAGFKKVEVFWEQDNDTYKKTLNGESNCDSWIATLGAS